MPGFTAYGSMQGGRLMLDDKRSFEAALTKLKDGPVAVRVEPSAETRSLAQNRFFHGPILNAFMTLGYHKQEAKDMLALQFIPIEVRMLDGSIVRMPGHTSALLKDEFTQFIEACLQLAAEQGLVVEDAAEWRQKMQAA